VIDEPTYAKSVEYTLAKGRFSSIESSWSTFVLLVFLFSGVLPWGYKLFTDRLGVSAWSQAAFLFVVGFALALPGLPFDWYSQFKLEDRFGFNTTTLRTWWLDRIKGLLLALALGYPLLTLVLKLVEWMGARWWLWAWGCVLGFQLLMVVLVPIVILPLFNKFTPLPEGPLRERLLTLGRRTGFTARSIQVMDGSKRSRHSNAFFTGFGRFRKIVLFDTLIEQLADPELEAVLVHEIGHSKKRHVPKMLAWSAVGLLVSLYAVAWLAKQEWFDAAFGFQPGNFAPALLIFALLSGAVTFWIAPLQNFWVRRFEYQADTFAAGTMGESCSLIGALRTLNTRNLSNLAPHPLYSGFYYSHPTLIERERALARTSH
jgi:STE24 endopeptidase